ncbi:MAG: hypothetical protein AB7P21_28815 [Lautropia sp.]
MSASVWLIVVVTANTVASQLLLKRALMPLGAVTDGAGLSRLVAFAATSPLVYASLALQVSGYLMWMVILSREKMGVAVALSGAFFYASVTLLAWMLHGERLNLAQLLAIGLITAGVLILSGQSG